MDIGALCLLFMLKVFPLFVYLHLYKILGATYPFHLLRVYHFSELYVDAIYISEEHIQFFQI